MGRRGLHPSLARHAQDGYHGQSEDRRPLEKTRHRVIAGQLYSAPLTVIALRFRTHRCGFLSPLSTSLNCPSSPNGLPFMLVATITLPSCSEPSISVTEYSTQYLS